MVSRIRRTLSVLCLTLVFCLPLGAQTAPRPADALSGFLSAFWTRLSVPLASIWAAEETDGRGAVDPDGKAAPTDGRGACDPDGAPACGS
jgi:hypothetical protein